MTSFIKQYGYYRTGTNFLKEALLANTDCRVLINELGCKHHSPRNWRRWLAKPDKPVPEGLPQAIAHSQVRVVVITKDPYAWLDSFKLYWAKRKRKSRSMDTEFYRDKIGEFTANYLTWISLLREGRWKGTWVRYEDLIADYPQAMRGLCKRLGLVLNHDPPIPITRRVDPHPHLRHRPLDPGYFLRREYLANLTPQDKQRLSELINWELFNDLGYKRL